MKSKFERSQRIKKERRQMTQRKNHMTHDVDDQWESISWDKTEYQDGPCCHLCLCDFLRFDDLFRRSAIHK